MQYQDLSSFTVPSNFRGRSKVVVQLWWLVQSTFFALSPQVFFGWRRFLLRLFGAKIGNNTSIRPSVKITYPWKLTVGSNTWIGDDTTLYTLGEIIIGNNVAIAHRVYLNTGGHIYTKPTFDIFCEPIIIEDECWITNDVFVASGISIGKGTIVGARSTVLHSLPSNKVCVGCPARPVKDRIPVPSNEFNNAKDLLNV
ncbi:colanic acid biosynthesis acetyltransferase WcaF [Mucilaginibacter achroorhodeus]|uniref:Colanic acid biosynthesis acetyltransferase WcaF n=1 Tax=Mucilaginibacter achroorhodeus TaxID=2599294 RepID=A0A563U6N4_9SPHI|nr:WcaF family extracellular polysaccharide biosynthesis acetyltransferase [Mucilaginibacter achroorhodeus]TWR27011.1 colanic acid biosynthesis acetyltransferase WcaF [Mucilaginibacter achroorhodeus]